MNRILIALIALTIAVINPLSRGDNETFVPMGTDFKPKEVLPPVASAGAKDLKASELVTVPVVYPRAVCVGTPKTLENTTLDRTTINKTRSMLVPRGVERLSLKKHVQVSDTDPIIGSIDQITDGDRDGTEGSFVEFGPGVQWVQVDLGASVELWAISIWHYHYEPRVYRDVIIQASNDPNFKTGVTTLFNNDQDNSSKMGAGTDREYLEGNEGKLIDARGTKARYIRCYSNGNTSDGQNHYVEVEAYGKPTK